MNVRRECPQCGQRQYEVAEDAATGPFARKGEYILFPRSLYQRQLTLTGGNSFSRRGVNWLASQLLPSPVGLLPAASGFEAGLRELVATAEGILQSCSLLESIDLETEAGAITAFDILSKHSADPAFTAFVLHAKAGFTANNASSATDAEGAKALAMAAWSAGAAAALLNFQTHLAEAAYRGNALEMIRWLISEWSKSQNNDSEAFWQDLLLSRPFALTQLFATPLVIHGERFLVGGMRAGGQHGKITDYLLRNQLTDAATIVEIKTPVTQLLYEKEYRQDVFVPSRELSGAVQQVLEQRAQFMKNMQGLQAEQETSEQRIEVVEPNCIVVIGNTTQLGTRARKRSFEAFRTELRNVRVVTFDEVFAKLNGLLGLFRGADAAAVGS